MWYNLDMEKIRSSSIERKQFFIDSIAKFCNKCGTPYSLEDVNIIQENNVSSIIHFSCHNCKIKHVATFVAPLGISNRVEINTDLTLKEIKNFATREEVSLEEILSVYTFLKSKNSITV
jgi:hypothetical protein